jgi:hypothetical protein
VTSRADFSMTSPAQWDRGPRGLGRTEPRMVRWRRVAGWVIRLLWPAPASAPILKDPNERIPQ